MRKFAFESTKERKLVTDLKTSLERRGWSITNEYRRSFKGRFNYDDTKPNPSLLGTWQIQRRTLTAVITLEFNGSYCSLEPDMELNSVSDCTVRDTDIELQLFTFHNLKTPEGKREWKQSLASFLRELDMLEVKLLDE